MTGKPNFPLITIMGPTASGKTPVATHLAYLLHGVVISGDSRQLYRGRDIGTGKDLADYNVGNEQIPYKLIDICNPGERYNIHAYQQRCMQELQQLEATPCILCGGSGLYIEAVFGQYGLAEVPEDKTLREKLLAQPLELLHQQLQQYPQHYWPRDLLNKRRVIRALEIASYYTQHPEATNRGFQRGAPTTDNGPPKSPFRGRTGARGPATPATGNYPAGPHLLRIRVQVCNPIRNGGTLLPANVLSAPNRYTPICQTTNDVD